MTGVSFAEQFLAESAQVVDSIDRDAIEACAVGLAEVRDRGGRLFILGVGGSAGHASHAVNDFRKICAFEAYTPTDNVSELTARANDDGFDTTFVEWLRVSRLSELDGVLVFSVGGGDAERGVSTRPRPGTRARSGVFGLDLWDRRARRRLHSQGRRRLRGHPAAVRRSRDAAHRRTLRGGLASVGQPPRTRPHLDQVGERHVSDDNPLARVLVIGGAGFIGSHVVDRLLDRDDTEAVTVYDNFSSGRTWHIASHETDPRFELIHGDVVDLEALCKVTEGHDTVVHLASNPDIARARVEPTIDFDQGTRLTNHVVEAIRRSGVRRLLYASGSGVYGDLGDLEVEEDYGPLLPESTYSASKLAGEALIAAYCALFDMTGCAFRFGNVVGPRQTHGVGFDFVRRLIAGPERTHDSR